ncbi:Cytochrome c551 peroxidase precursor [Botrimarina colliarenosi]|uniref:Cytochrome c551 peroxidase n=1 Tax=Botrimarina colliarenosi TaxID=2528001 RepID=A0A5C6AMZ4_9BACT|nr:cytochrome c peroxidase [Botrimarina colliarenosi]TWT99533.1 Cytochrome c551 peroxidase precursor [Botrimarina colliarenosi]
MQHFGKFSCSLVANGTATPPIKTVAVAVALGALASGLLSLPASAAPPQVPGLPSQTAEYIKYALQDLPTHFQVGEVAALDNTPADNLLTDAGATLGRVLFYDTRLSHDSSISCASCHQQANGFSDPDQFSEGINGQRGDRHSMALANGKYYVNGAAFWDERAESLEAQALMPIENPLEMGATLSEVVDKLGQTTFYPTLFTAAFGTAEITPERIGKAIAQFERAMVSYQSKFDTAFAPGSTTPDFESVFTADELAGQAIFHGAGRCSGCHTTEAQVGQQIANVGLDADPLDGVPVDEGAGEGRFKTPSLRNVAVRGHFMHDGRFSSLQEVVEFYSTGVQDNESLDESLRNPLRLRLSEQEVSQLVAFLETLTDETFLTSDLFSDPFVTLPGDYNGDGEVDSADYDVWVASYGDTTSLVADGNGDQVVDAADYTVWRDNYGQSWLTVSAAGNASTPTPEPATLGLAALVIAAMASRRRRLRS